MLEKFLAAAAGLGLGLWAGQNKLLPYNKGLYEWKKAHGEPIEVSLLERVLGPPDHYVRDEKNNAQKPDSDSPKEGL